jgi:hypothetical protein
VRPRPGSASAVAARSPLSGALPGDKGWDGGSGMKRDQDRKQSQQVTWQVLSELCKSRMFDAPQTPLFLVLKF